MTQTLNYVSVTPAARAEPATRPRRRRPVDRATPQIPLNYRPFPAWARLEPKPLEEGPAAFFAAGAGLALLDGILRQNPPCAGALRNRLGLIAEPSRQSTLSRRVRVFRGFASLSGNRTVARQPKKCPDTTCDTTDFPTT